LYQASDVTAIFSGLFRSLSSLTGTSRILSGAFISVGEDPIEIKKEGRIRPSTVFIFFISAHVTDALQKVKK